METSAGFQTGSDQSPGWLCYSGAHADVPAYPVPSIPGRLGKHLHSADVIECDIYLSLLCSFFSFLENASDADLWLLNSCTVKNPAEDHFRNSIK
jgi:hypothetical protein